MMQYTDMHDRYLLRLISKKIFLYTEMIATGSLIYGKCLDQLDFNKEEHPVGIQLGGSDINDLVECSKMSEQRGYDEINLNVGCPSDRVQKGKFGACLMLEPNLVGDCLKNMQDAVNIPVSIKCRLGIDENISYEFLYNFISIVKESGINIFIIHARNGILSGLSPRQNRNVPPLKYDYVYKLKEDFPELEIIINGGIKSLEESKTHLKKVDGVMIGRAAYDNPFMLKDIESNFYNIDSCTESKKEILNKYLEYVEMQLKNGHNLSKMMKHLFGLSRGDKYAKTFRIKIIEIMKNNSLKGHKEDLEKLLVY
ncbi:MAG: tRNA dihydrouridine(20/20a) synthase DusA [SAR86 cluster bacterium]|mgnify:FL=1|uniref:tRNA-dihydrouridine synthase n=1 Tax=SAR86 cluster bacterium TaxID=2030880 RepID=A0A520MUB0_9GAMM|nr:MAG: tRNA dihydrouridine(20/20a) synthase DusA [SAR86 cluster bacterium]